MRISLNDQASAELLELMKIMGVSNPTHLANKLISEIYQMKTATPREVNNGKNRHTQEM